MFIGHYGVALALKRATGLKLDTATFTNLSRDHLDFHGSLEEYASAKRKLFELVNDDGWKPGGAAILNGDDDLGRELIEDLRGSQRVVMLVYGFEHGDVHAADVKSTSRGTSARFATPLKGCPGSVDSSEAASRQRGCRRRSDTWVRTPKSR